MSILKSTKSGKCVVPITIKYLTDHHWRFKAQSKVSVIDYDVIWKNKDHYLNIKRDDFRSVSYLYLKFETQKYIYKFKVLTVGDLDLVEKFWQKSKTAITKEAIDILRQNEANLIEEENPLWEYSENYYTFNGNYNVYTDYGKDVSCQTWKTKNSKNYFASYFK